MTVAKLRNQFLIRALILSIILVATHSVFTILDLGITVSIFPIIVLLFLLVSFAAHLFMLKTAAISFQKFTNAFMLSTTVKLLFYLGFMAAYAFTNRDVAKIFIFNFTAIYFIFTPFDVIMILKQVKKLGK